MKIKITPKKLLWKLPILLLIGAVFVGISFYEKTWIFSTTNRSNNNSILKAIQEVYPQAASFQQSEDNEPGWFDIYDKNNNVLGKYAVSTTIGTGRPAYGGPLHFIVALSLKNRIQGIGLLPNRETPRYIYSLENMGFFSAWNGIPIEKAGTYQVDAVSGATFTTKAIISNMNNLLSILDGKTPFSSNQKYQFSLLDALALVMIGLSLALFFTNKIKKFRPFILAGNILVLGFLRTDFLSIQLFRNIFASGLNILFAPIISLIIIPGILFPLLLNKNFYCQYVCPFGAAQELVGKIGIKKIKLPNALSRGLKGIKILFLAAITGLILLNIAVDLSLFEPFTAFAFQTASIITIIAAALFLVLSLFIPKAWCNNLCPTGTFLELLRRGLSETSASKANKPKKVLQKQK